MGWVGVRGWRSWRTGEVCEAGRNPEPALRAWTGTIRLQIPRFLEAKTLHICKYP